MTYQLQVVWPKPWVADAFEEAGCDVTRHTGFDVVVQNGPIWWATEHAARSIAAGHPTMLSAPGWRDLLRLPERMLKRHVWASTIGALYQTCGLTAFVKPAGCKIVGPGDTGKPQVSDAAVWAEACLEHGVYPQTVALVSTPVRWREEWRCWWDGAKVTEISLYQREGQTWDEWPRVTPTATLRYFADSVGCHVGQPCVIDVGILNSNKLAVVEFNPVWSSGPYTSDMGRVYAAIRAGYEWAAAGRGTSWKPEPWLLRKRATL